MQLGGAGQLQPDDVTVVPFSLDGNLCAPLPERSQMPGTTGTIEHDHQSGGDDRSRNLRPWRGPPCLADIKIVAS